MTYGLTGIDVIKSNNIGNMCQMELIQSGIDA